MNSNIFCFFIKPAKSSMMNGNKYNYIVKIKGSESNELSNLKKFIFKEGLSIDDINSKNENMFKGLYCIPIYFDINMNFTSIYSFKKPVKSSDYIVLLYLERDPIQTDIYLEKMSYFYIELYNSFLLNSKISSVSMILNYKRNSLDKKFIKYEFLSLRISKDVAVKAKIIKNFEKKESIHLLSRDIYDLALAYSVLTRMNIFDTFIKINSSLIKVAFFEKNSINSRIEKTIFNSLLKKIERLIQIDVSIVKRGNFLSKQLYESETKCKGLCLNKYSKNLNKKNIQVNHTLLSNKTNELKFCKDSCPIFLYYQARFINFTATLFSNSDVVIYYLKQNEFNIEESLPIYSDFLSISFSTLLNEFKVHLCILSRSENIAKLFKVAELLTEIRNRK
jgi:hypothetical protein